MVTSTLPTTASGYALEPQDTIVPLKSCAKQVYKSCPSSIEIKQII